MHTFSDKNVLLPKLTELLRLWALVPWFPKKEKKKKKKKKTHWGGAIEWSDGE